MMSLYNNDMIGPSKGPYLQFAIFDNGELPQVRRSFLSALALLCSIFVSRITVIIRSILSPLLGCLSRT